MLPAAGALPPEEFRQLLLSRASRYGLALSKGELDRMAGFLAVLDSARRETNLTGPLSTTELSDHALESALGAPLLPASGAVVDIGSGGGFPGLPLAIMRSDIRMLLVEPRRKRAEFLTRSAASIPLENVSGVAPRLSHVRSDFADAATARAVGSLEEVLGEAGFLKAGGSFLAWTTEPDELAGRLRAHFQLETTVAVPESRTKVIAVFRKRGVPRGTIAPR